MVILAATKWPTNANLIVACHELGYLQDDDVVVDPTYGNGNWWTKWWPKILWASDIDRDKCYVQADFRDLPYANDSVDAVAFDPPYVSPGGRTTSGIPEFHDRYGMNETAKSPRLLFENNALGFAECVRVLKPGGYLLYKSMDYISSGTFQPVTHWIIDDADDRGVEYIDRLEHIGDPRPQPSGRRQVHARRNLSTMLIFRKPR